MIAAQEEDGPSVFDDYTPDEIKKAKDRKKERQKERKPLPKPKFTWFKHIQNTISKAAGDIFDDMENEEI